MNKLIYMDNSATTPVTETVLKAMLPYFSESYGNPSSVYGIARSSKTAMDEAREKVAKAINATASEIYFTGSGTESDNWAIKGVAEARAASGKKHIITTNFEHHAVSHTMEVLKKQGFEITEIEIDDKGLITAEQVKNALRDDTALVSIMYANNEIGTVLPIAEIGKLCRERKVPFHTDAVQAVGNIPVDVVADNVDLLTISAHKLGGPKGVGALYVRRGIAIRNLIDGGAQEKTRRAGTENVPGIVGLGVAIEESIANMEKHSAHKQALREHCIDRVLAEIPKSQLNGDRVKRLPGNANFSFMGVEGEGILLMLDMNGICVSSGSACTSGSLDPSHVLMALGLEHEVAHGSVRATFSIENTMEDVDFFVDTLKTTLERLRAMSPLWDKM